jgi:hypothetical protein
VIPLVRAVLVPPLVPPYPSFAPAPGLRLLGSEDAEQPAHDGDRREQAEDATTWALGGQGARKSIKVSWFHERKASVSHTNAAVEANCQSGGHHRRGSLDEFLVWSMGAGHQMR